MADDGSARQKDAWRQGVRRLAESWCIAENAGAPMVRRVAGFSETLHSIDLTHKASIVRCAVAIMARSLMMSRLILLTVLMLGLLAVTAPQAQVVHNAPDAPALLGSMCAFLDGCKAGTHQ
jgi:hypothetical protein